MHTSDTPNSHWYQYSLKTHQMNVGAFANQINMAQATPMTQREKQPLRQLDQRLSRASSLASVGSKEPREASPERLHIPSQQQTPTFNPFSGLNQCQKSTQFSQSPVLQGMRQALAPSTTTQLNSPCQRQSRQNSFGNQNLDCEEQILPESAQQERRNSSMGLLERGVSDQISISSNSEYQVSEFDSHQKVQRSNHTNQSTADTERDRISRMMSPSVGRSKGGVQNDMPDSLKKANLNENDRHSQVNRSRRTRRYSQYISHSQSTSVKLRQVISKKAHQASCVQNAQNTQIGPGRCTCGTQSLSKHSRKFQRAPNQTTWGSMREKRQIVAPEIWSLTCQKIPTSANVFQNDEPMEEHRDQYGAEPVTEPSNSGNQDCVMQDSATEEPKADLEQINEHDQGYQLLITAQQTETQGPNLQQSDENLLSSPSVLEQPNIQLNFYENQVAELQEIKNLPDQADEVQPEFQLHTEQEYQEEVQSLILRLVQDSIWQIQKHFPNPSDLPRNSKDQNPFLPPQEISRPTLVLDLDETLVHCSLTPFRHAQTTFSLEGEEIEIASITAAPSDTSGDQEMSNQTQKQESTIYVAFRPYLIEFLATVSQLFEIVLFTASERDYADKVIQIFDPQGIYIHQRLYRQHCTVINGHYYKDLSRLGRPLSHTILVDNSVQAFGLQLANGVPIPSFLGQPWDCELYLLSGILQDLFSSVDVREKIDEIWGLSAKVWPNPDTLTAQTSAGQSMTSDCEENLSYQQQLKQDQDLLQVRNQITQFQSQPQKDSVNQKWHKSRKFDFCDFSEVNFPN